MIPAVLLCGLFSLQAVRGEKSAFLPIAGLFLALGYLSVEPWTAPRFPARHIIGHADTRACRVTGLVDSSPLESAHRVRFVLKSQFLERGMETHPVSGKIRVTMPSQGPGLRFGDAVCLTGRIAPIRSFRNPGGFDYRKYMAYQGIWVSMYVSPEDVCLLERKAETGIRGFIGEIREEVLALIGQTGTPETRGVLAALLVGDRSGIPAKTRDDFNRAGLGHLLAISGLHMGTIAASAFFVFSWALSRVSVFLRAAWTRKASAILTLFPVIFYGLLAGMSPSTQRAVIMAGIFLLAFLLERDHDPTNTLAVAALLILLVHPPALFSASFQLSFAAVFAIVCGISHISMKRAVEGALRRRLVDSLLVTVLAVLGTLPLIMYYFNQVSLVGIASNFFVVPPVGFIVVPLGLLSVFVYPVSYEVALLLMKASAAVMEISLKLGTFFSHLPYAAVKTVTPGWAEMACYYLLAWGILGLLGRKEDRSPWGFRKVAAGAVILSLLIGAADVLYWVQTRLRHRDLRVTILDVGQGSAALVEFPEGPCMLIDGGGFPDHLAFDIGEKVVAPFLWRNKIRTIDTMVLSHPDSDHMNGLFFIARHFNVKEVWAVGDSSESESFRRFVDILDQRNIRRLPYAEISRSRQIRGAKVELLYPPGDFHKRKKKERWRNWNNCSLTVRITFGSRSFLFPGDIMADAEEELVSMAGPDLKSGVLVAPHHGSRTSSTPEFIRQVNPEVVVISSGRKIRKSEEAVLERYRQLPCRIYRTYDDGAVCMSTDGAGLWIKTARGAHRLGDP